MAGQVERVLMLQVYQNDIKQPLRLSNHYNSPYAHIVDICGNQPIDPSTTLPVDKLI